MNRHFQEGEYVSVITPKGIVIEAVVDKVLDDGEYLIVTRDVLNFHDKPCNLFRARFEPAMVITGEA